MTTYLQDSEGKFIPPSQRPDGTWRKARRVKDGYVPQEEVPLYESKGKLFAKKPSLPVGMCPNIAQQSKEEWLKKQRRQETEAANIHSSITPKASQPNKISGLTKAIAKNNQLENSNKAVKGQKVSTGAISKTKPNHQQQQQDVDNLAAKLEETTLGDPEVELAKKLKKLKKKIREIEVIENKLKSGELNNPEKDQLDKVGRKASIMNEIEMLEKPK